MRANGRGRLLKPKFGRLEARGMVLSAAVHVLKRGDLRAHELLMKVFKEHAKVRA